MMDYIQARTWCEGLTKEGLAIEDKDSLQLGAAKVAELQDRLLRLYEELLLLKDQLQSKL